MYHFTNILDMGEGNPPTPPVEDRTRFLSTIRGKRCRNVSATRFLGIWRLERKPI